MNLDWSDKLIVAHTWWLSLETLRIGEGGVDTIEDLINLILELFYQTNAYKSINTQYKEVQSNWKMTSEVKKWVLRGLLAMFGQKEIIGKPLTEKEILGKLEELDIQEAYALCDFVMNTWSGERDYRRREILIGVILEYTKRRTFGNSRLDFSKMAEVLEELESIEKAEFIKDILGDVMQLFLSNVVTLTVNRKDWIVIIGNLRWEIIDILWLNPTDKQ